MRKALVVLAALSVSTGAFAQKAKVYSAKEYMADGDMKKALTSINEAVNSESTKNDGDAWFVRGLVYEKLAETDPTALEESTKSYLKVVEVKPSFPKDQINNKLSRIMSLSYNAAVTESQAATPNYDKIIASYQTVIDIHNLNGGKQFAGDKIFDTTAAKALKFQALSAAYGKKGDQAIALLSKAKADPIARDPYIFSTLIDIYSEKNDLAAAEKTLDEAKAAFPKNPEIARQEMNYYQRTNKTDVLVKKMEEAVKTDPDNPLLQYNLGVIYGSLANPVDAAGKLKEKPANSKELEAKAETAYKMAIDADPNKAEYVYNLGALYFNNAADITTKMNALGTTEADNKKYDQLKALRLAEFTKGLKYFQTSYNLLSPKAGSMNSDDTATYRGTLIALQTIYEALGQSEKADEMAKKLAAL